MMSRLFEKLSACNRKLVFGTHSGTFHCDEVVAISMLQMLVPEFDLVRSRDPAVLEKADLIVDVGGVFDTESFRFDHHQRGFGEFFSEDYKAVTRLSSAGLIYKYFGRDLLQKVYSVSDSMLEKAFLRVYDKFICSVDAIDNGVDIADKRKYSVNTDLASRIGRLNPAWNEDAEDENERFRKAMAIASEEIHAQIHGVVKIWLPARVIVQEAYAKRFDYHPSGHVLKLSQFCPWIEHLADIEEAREEVLGEKRKPVEPEVLFGVFTDTTGQFRVRAVPKERGSFENKLSFPERLCGLRDADLDAKTGIQGMVFVHQSGFIAGTKTEFGALALIDLTLQDL